MNNEDTIVTFKLFLIYLISSNRRSLHSKNWLELGHNKTFSYVLFNNMIEFRYIRGGFNFLNIKSVILVF